MPARVLISLKFRYKYYSIHMILSVNVIGLNCTNLRGEIEFSENCDVLKYSYLRSISKNIFSFAKIIGNISNLWIYWKG